MRILLIKSTNILEHILYGPYKEVAFVVQIANVTGTNTSAVCQRDFTGKWVVTSSLHRFLAANRKGVEQIEMFSKQSPAKMHDDFLEVLGNRKFKGVVLKPARAIFKILYGKDWTGATIEKLVDEATKTV